MTPMTVLVLVGVAVLVALACVRRIPEGQAYTLRRLGGHLRTIGAGTHIVLPGVERVAHRIRLLGNVVTLDRVAADSGKALAGAVYYQVLDAERADAVIDRVETLVRDCLPALLGAARDEDDAARNLRLKAELNRELRDRGILITRVQLGAA